MTGWTKLGAVFLVAAVFLIPYATGLEIRNDAVQNCDRGKGDKLAIASIAQAALDGFHQTDARQPGPNTPARAAAEHRLVLAHHRMIVRVRQDCRVLHPKPSLFR